MARHDVPLAIFRGMAADLMGGRRHTAKLTLAAREEIALGLARERRFGGHRRSSGPPCVDGEWRGRGQRMSGRLSGVGRRTAGPRTSSATRPSSPVQAMTRETFSSRIPDPLTKRRVCPACGLEPPEAVCAWVRPSSDWRQRGPRSPASNGRRWLSSSVDPLRLWEAGRDSSESPPRSSVHQSKRSTSANAQGGRRLGNNRYRAQNMMHALISGVSADETLPPLTVGPDHKKVRKCTLFVEDIPRQSAATHSYGLDRGFQNIGKVDGLPNDRTRLRIDGLLRIRHDRRNTIGIYHSWRACVRRCRARGPFAGTPAVNIMQRPPLPDDSK